MDMNLLDQLAEISHRLDCGAELLYALFCALRHDDYVAKDFAPAMCAAQIYIAELSEGLHALVNEVRSIS